MFDFLFAKYKITKYYNGFDFTYSIFKRNRFPLLPFIFKWEPMGQCESIEKANEAIEIDSFVEYRY